MAGKRIRPIPKIGEKIGLLTVTSEPYSIKDKYGVLIKHINVECECGVKKPMILGSVVPGNYKTCGAKFHKIKHTPEIGQKFGELTVIGNPFSAKHTNGRTLRFVDVICDCGTKTTVQIRNLLVGRAKTCNKIEHYFQQYPKIGDKFGFLTVISQPFLKLTPWKEKIAHVKLQCICGEIKQISISVLNKGEVQSCGCKRDELIGNKNRTHGCYKERLYSIWNGMKERCHNPKSQQYNNYGGKGVIICKDWLNNYENFKIWAHGHGYTDGLSIERINSDGNYCPENCEWITIGENARRATLSRKLREKRLKEENESLKIENLELRRILSYLLR